MEWAIILMMLLIVVAIGAIKLNDQGLNFPFKRKENLFSPAERRFLELIEQAVGHQFRIICRVKLSDIVSLRQNTDKKTAHAALSRASTKQLDFVLCSKDDMNPIVAIDLVHGQGKEGHKAQRDWYVSSALDAARIPHLRIKVKPGYSVQEIRDCIEAKLAPLKRKEPKPLIPGSNNPDNPNAHKPTRPLRSSRPAAA
ncbi:DUF2726 domain-containing protein [Aestuariibacter halophilus]|uniref:DUF2726 domain-containing protein n=1 Tax=Fluctibacter halophilus TaxID=226011 RepID=A0ABS8GA13_9ALTE|nr:DUF2726 domain-containing protein [Aestuariibacter halophilus]MCC2617432.1 DUF2726 domain-containing protein [Aestuariibacter halophilus]